MKRKDVDEVSDDFSLSSPARKVRRLDWELPPIMEDLEEDMLGYGRPVGVPGRMEIEELDAASRSPGEENPERVIVLFKPVGANSPMLYSPSRFSVSLDSGFLSDLMSKNQFLWSDKKLEEGEKAERSTVTKDCMAVVPWVPSQFPRATDFAQTDAPEFMEAECMGETTMDIEDNCVQNVMPTQAFELGGMQGNYRLPQWQQQHCTVPQLPQNNPTPVTWFK